MINVYYCDITFLNENFDVESIFCAKRREYINSVANTKRAQCFYVWKLLERLVGHDKADCHLFCTETGKWLSDNNLYFSISHSHNIVAVSLSYDKENGVDIEIISPRILSIEKKLITQNFCNFFKKTIPEKEKFLTKLWTEKECFFKCGNIKPSKSIEIMDFSGARYVLSACGDGEIVFNEIKEI